MSHADGDDTHRTLYEKLGVDSGAHVALVGPHDQAFVAELSARLANGASRTLRTKYDAIFVRIDKPPDVERIARAATHLDPSGALWVFHPKGEGAHVSDAALRVAAGHAGLVEDKVSDYSDTHVATRFVVAPQRR